MQWLWYKHLNTPSQGSTGSAREGDIAVAMSWFSLILIRTFNFHCLCSDYLEFDLAWLCFKDSSRLVGWLNVLLQQATTEAIRKVSHSNCEQKHPHKLPFCRDLALALPLPLWRSPLGTHFCSAKVKFECFDNSCIVIMSYMYCRQTTRQQVQILHNLLKWKPQS